MQKNFLLLLFGAAENHYFSFTYTFKNVTFLSLNYYVNHFTSLLHFPPYRIFLTLPRVLFIADFWHAPARGTVDNLSGFILTATDFLHLIS